MSADPNVAAVQYAGRMALLIAGASKGTERPVRRRWVSELPLRGISSYVVQTAAEAGFFDGPGGGSGGGGSGSGGSSSKVALRAFARSQAVRAGVAVRLAWGEALLPEAVDELGRALALSPEAAQVEADSLIADLEASLASQVAQSEVLRFWRNRREAGEVFTAFHRSLFANAMVPVALQEEEAVTVAGGGPRGS